ncbi:hypothetical protein AJ80_02523 [Polytolypa hystricis UAMH7299]|uniref:DNA/RNA-binding domain-containing protein n=1 Tax=Polytolypa hystricis (strain UAMH7299) TaxID=1447883 RepID=A0A2B7YQZ3_POLH7|nr:hypothetical protein AJ80_02523 [Polytolypa hystricis UAMH7299]
MASSRQDNGKIFELQGEKELLKSLDEKEPTFAEIEHYVTRFRDACQNEIFRNLEGGNTDGEAAARAVEGRLWEGHLKINARFRKRLSRFRDGNGKKRPVEKRKLEKHYLNFIQSSQRFYRGYIQHLLSQFEGIPGLEKVANTREFGFERLSANPKPNISNELRSAVLLSCHTTIIRLGDLSRYREMELVPPSKDRNWDPAISYYNLAEAINPDSGVSHNQLAVIGLVSGNHLQATYHLYRALSAKEPYPTSGGNLDIEFRKILSIVAKGELLTASKDEKAQLISSFLDFHAQCYKGVDSPMHDELENEILGQIAVDLKEQSLEPLLLQKFCLINIAAEHYARSKMGDPNATMDKESTQLNFFQRLNVKMFFTLLQLLLAELECSVGAESETVTAVARCILPVLRQYSSWLLYNSAHLASEVKDSALHVQINELWKIYASTLSLLASSYDVVNLPDIEYLLKEDEDTLGFTPLSNEATSGRYLDEQGSRKPRSNDVTKNYPVNAEMLFRIREFVIDGLNLVVHEKIPIILVDNEDTKVFVYKEYGLPQFSAPSSHQNTLPSTGISPADIQVPSISHAVAEDGTSQSASLSVSAAMNRMVDALVDSEPMDSFPPPSDKPFSTSTMWRNDPGPSQPSQQDAENTVNGISNFNTYTPPMGPDPGPSFSPRPALPSILNTPFAPQPGEALSPRSRPSTAREVDQLPLSMTAEGNGSLSNSPLTSSQLAFRNSLLAAKSPQLQYQQALEFEYLTSSSSLSATQSPRYRYEGGYLYNPPNMSGLPHIDTSGHHYLDNNRGGGGGASPFSSGFSSYPYSYSPSGGNTAAGGSSGGNRSVVAAAHFGAIGQTPPSGQGG